MIFKLFKKWSFYRLPWFILALSALSFELTALYFQYVKLLEPCVMCVYERTAMLGILISALIAMIGPRVLIIRFIGAIGFLTSSSWGFALAWHHTQLQLHPSPFATCSPYPNFPAWLQLNEWFPFMFQPHGDCSAIVWKLLNWSMPEWLILSFAIYMVIAIAILAGQFRK